MFNRQTFSTRSNATEVGPDDIPPEWRQEETDIESTPRDSSRDYDACTYGSIETFPPSFK